MTLKKLWYTLDDDQNKILLTDEDGYIVYECCCRPCAEGHTYVDASSCPCYEADPDPDEPHVMQLFVDCDGCEYDQRKGRALGCWWGSEEPLSCYWMGGLMNEVGGEGTCLYQINCLPDAGEDGKDYWYCTVSRWIDFMDPDPPPVCIMTGSASEDWDCTGSLVLQGDDTYGTCECDEGTLTITPFVWEVPE